jgi:hypothetical protein
VRLFFPKVLGQLGVARFEQGIVQREGASVAATTRRCLGPNVNAQHACRGRMSSEGGKTS